MSDFVPQEVVINILTRLPPKSLIKFRCVSKSWNSLISSPYFISLHTKQTVLANSVTTPTDHVIIRRYSKSKNSEIYLVHVDNEEFPQDKSIKIEYPFRDFTRFYYRIVGSCNGVLCLYDDLFGNTNSILLWNPAIQRQITLPVPQQAFKNMRSYVCVLGFGFDGINNDYKVVRIVYIQENYAYVMPPTVEVYSVSLGNWRKINGEAPKNCVVEYFWAQALILGNVHWVAYRKKENRSPVENLIMVFDMTYEVFEEMELPGALRNELPFRLNAAAYKEFLAVFQYDERVLSKHCSIWIMKKYGVVDSWSKQFCVDIDEGFGSILGFRRNSDVLLTAKNGRLVSYNKNSGALMDLGIFGPKSSIYVDTYVESLALLNEGKEAQGRLPSERECKCGSYEEGNYRRRDNVEKSEFWVQSATLLYLTALHDR